MHLLLSKASVCVCIHCTAAEICIGKGTVVNGVWYCMVLYRANDEYGAILTMRIHKGEAVNSSETQGKLRYQDSEDFQASKFNLIRIGRRRSTTWIKNYNPEHALLSLPQFCPLFLYRPHPSSSFALAPPPSPLLFLYTPPLSSSFTLAPPNNRSQTYHP